MEEGDQEKHQLTNVREGGRSVGGFSWKSVATSQVVDCPMVEVLGETKGSWVKRVEGGKRATRGGRLLLLDVVCSGC